MYDAGDYPRYNGTYRCGVMRNEERGQLDHQQCGAQPAVWSSVDIDTGSLTRSQSAGSSVARVIFERDADHVRLVDVGRGV